MTRLGDTLNPIDDPDSDPDKHPRQGSQEGKAGRWVTQTTTDTHWGTNGANDTIEANEMTRTNTTTKRDATRKTDTVSTPKATRKATRIDFDDTYLLQAIRTIPDTDRRAIVTTAKLMKMATTAKAGDVLRELGRELRDTPALRADPMALGIILRGVAQAFDGVGQGGTE